MVEDLGEMCSGDVEVAYNTSCSDAGVELKVVAASMWVPTLLGLLHGGDLQSAKDPCSFVGHWQTFLKLGNFKKMPLHRCYHVSKSRDHKDVLY